MINDEELKQLNVKELKQSIIDRLTIEANNGIKSDVSAIDAVRFRMDAYGLNKKEFANIIGMSQNGLHRFMKGKIIMPRKSIVKCIAIGVSYKALLCDV